MTRSRHVTKEEKSKNISKAKKKWYNDGGVHPRGMLGKTAWNKGLKTPPEIVEKLRTAKLGKKASQATKKKMSLARKGIQAIWTLGRIPWNKGKKFPQISGEKHYLWMGDRSEAVKRRRLRGTLEWKLWRASVFERDNYICQDCGACGVYLEAHHIIPIRSDMSKAFDLTNGITLCRQCHQKTIWKESDFAEKYSAIVAAH